MLSSSFIFLKNIFCAFYFFYSIFYTCVYFFQTHLIWPAAVRNGEPRCMERILQTVAAIDMLSQDEKEGIMGYSPFMDYPDFDYIEGFPVEYLHHSCLGVTKRMVEMTFSIGDNRKRITKRKRSSTNSYNRKMALQKVVSEFGRRGRNLDFKVMKGEEFRNLVLFFFPFVLDSIPNNSKNDKNERKLWLLYVFQIRAYVLPDDEYSNVNQDVLDFCSNEFLVLFEELFGTSNSSYNIHMMSHLKQVRLRGKFTDTSTFKHESYYGEMRRSYVTGTASTGKQILKNAYIRRSIPHANCRKPLKFSSKETSRSSDKFIYIYKDNSFNFYVIKSIMQDGSMICVQHGRRSYKPSEVSLDWSSVGVFLKSGESDLEQLIRPQEVTGKAIVVDNFIISCPTNVLQE